MQKNSLGERTWQRVRENYLLAEQREVYRRLHNGKEQPGLLVDSVLNLVATAKPSGILDAGAALQRRHSLELK